MNGKSLPRHVAIIMDGNGRWAKAAACSRYEGHAEGARAVRETVETAARVGIKYLTLYAFSVANWARPRIEVEALMRLLVDFAKHERAELRRTASASTSSAPRGSAHDHAPRRRRPHRVHAPTAIA